MYLLATVAIYVLYIHHTDIYTIVTTKHLAIYLVHICLGVNTADNKAKE